MTHIEQRANSLYWTAFAHAARVLIQRESRRLGRNLTKAEISASTLEKQSDAIARKARKLYVDEENTNVRYKLLQGQL